MARGRDGARSRAPRILTRPIQPDPKAGTSLALAMVVLLGACGESGAPPTLAPAPTFVVVTATPGPPPAPTPGERQRYVVREGDTLSGIAAQFGVSEEEILAENRMADPNRLLVGQELIIPPGQP